MRKKIIAGNWKMNKTPSETVKLIEELKPLVNNDEVDVIFCVPAISLTTAIEVAKGSNISIGAENMYYEESGAYTGEIAPNMLTDIGVKYVIIGHSERREYFAETKNEYSKRRDVVYNALKNMNDVVCEKPHGAFYVVAKLPVKNAEDFVVWLLREFDIDNETLMMAPAEGFYATKGLGRDEVRISYCLNVNDLERAMYILNEALKVYPGRK